ncbi:MAG: hypothetical protein GDA51_09175 [Ekhidna sp.]|nr:hypothetical protein [Ekhidna sp.]MBC6410303.1 hypothetical protein [Ekhidna sp.]MBC6426618.1 hypothetical protein [Ekhidna sp.]
MFFIKSKDRRKNVIAAILLSLLMAGSALLDTNHEMNSTHDNSIQEAGWFRGWYKISKTQLPGFSVLWKM